MCVYVCVHVRQRGYVCILPLSEKDAVIESFTKRTRYLELKYDRLEQYDRRNMIRIRGIPEPDNATTEKTDAEVIKLADKLQIFVTQSDIDISHRVGTKRDQQSCDILVTFVSNNAVSNHLDHINIKIS